MKKKKLSIKQLKRLLGKASKTSTNAITFVVAPAPLDIPADLETEDLDEDISSVASVFQSVVAALRAHGFEMYLTGTLGGGRNATSGSRGTLCTAKFLIWSHRHVKGAELEPTDTLMWLHSVITEEYQSLLDYSIYMSTQLSRSPSTIRNHAGEVLACCRWYALFCVAARGKLTGADLAGIIATTSAIQKSEGKREKKHRSDLTMAGKVLTRRMPPGGLAQLQKAVLDRIAWAQQLVSLQYLDKGTYDEFMRLLYAAMYVCAAQGRVGGITSLTLLQGKQMMQEGHAFSTTFKTQAAWAYQPVMLTETTRSLLLIYLDHLRTQRPHASSAGEDPLWLDYEGQADTKLGKKVVRFFRHTIDLHMTTTSIRSLVETTMHDAKLKGTITHEEQQSVHAINGHSGKTTVDYYVMQDRTNEVTCARSAFERICSRTPAVSADALFDDAIPDVDFDAASCDDFTAPSTPLHTSPQRVAPTVPQRATMSHVDRWSRSDALVAADWGTDHPDYGLPGRRAQWTREEVSYVGRYCEQKMLSNPDCSNVVAECLKTMLRDPVAVAIFHKIHVLDTGRLRNGYRVYQQLKARGEWP